MFRITRAVLIVLVAATLAGCGSGGNSGSAGNSGNATLNLALTDAPVDSATHVVISFTGVQLQPSGGGPVVTKSFMPAKTIDLATLQNGNVADLLNGVSVPAGHYDWIRLMLDVGSGNVVVNSYIEIAGAQYPFMLIVPSGGHTGLKLVQGFTMTANQVADFTIDFVLQQAITAPPGQQVNGVQVYLLRPALRLIDNIQAGSITGTVDLTSVLQNQTPSCFDSTGAVSAHVYIFAGANAPLTDIETNRTSGVNPVVTPPVTLNGSGQYVFTQDFLQAGPYTLAVACGTDNPTADDLTAQPPALAFVTPAQTATVVANQTTTVTFPPSSTPPPP